MASSKQKSSSLVRWMAFAMIAALAGVFVVTAMMRQRSVDQKSGEYKEKGAAFGALTDQAGCMQEGFLRSRSATETETTEASLNTSFTSACLRSSRPTVDFCKAIPVFDLEKWENAQCQIAGVERAQPGCLKLLEAKIDFCAITR